MEAQGSPLQEHLAITTRDAFDAWVSSVASEHHSKRLVLRGQTHGYAPRPSAARPAASEDEELARHYAGVVWEAAAQAVLPGGPSALSSPSPDRLAVGMAVLQHYGFRSWFVDVTDDPAVALWFARWRYADEGVWLGLGNHEEGSPTQHALSPARLAQYVSHDGDGYVDAFAVEPDSALLLDLPQVVPAVATRVHRQSGAGLLPDDDGAYQSTHVARVVVRVPPKEAEQHSGGRRLDQEWLFPDTSQDLIYAALLSAPRPIRAQDLKAHGSVASDLLDLPVYMRPDSSSFRSWLDGLVAVAGDYALVPQLPESPEGAVQADITLPFTPPSGPAHTFTRDAYLRTKQDQAQPQMTDERSAGASEEDDMSAPILTMAAMHASWPGFPLLLRVPFTRELPQVLSRGRIFPLVRGYLFALDGGSRLQARQLFEDDEGYYWSPPVRLGLPWSPNLAEGRRLAKETELGTDGPVGDVDEDGYSEQAAELVLGLHLLVYTGALQEGRAALHQHCLHGYGLYWAAAGPAVAPIGPLWSPD